MLGVMILAKLQHVSNRVSIACVFKSLTNHRFVCALYTVENAKIFKEELLKKNVKNSNTLNLSTLRLGITSIIALSNSI